MIKEYQEQSDPDGPDVIKVGSCGLHVVHRAYGTVQKAADWNLGTFSIFKISVALSIDYLKKTFFFGES